MTDSSAKQPGKPPAVDPVDTAATARPRVWKPEFPPAAASKSMKEIGGREGPEPTRFGDWERNGRCIDF